MTLLYRHPDTPAGAVQDIDVELDRAEGGALARFRVNGDPARLVIPPTAPARRADGLWRTTCCELFVAGIEGADYVEFNFSPTGQWAAYRFSDYRQGMVDADAVIDVKFIPDSKGFLLEAMIGFEIPNPARAGLTVVVEEADGLIRYWATGFAPGKADFHADAVRNLLFDGVSAE
nr:DOMON-like domain-containing protein [uncultured Sphingomonas sp.]